MLILRDLLSVVPAQAGVILCSTSAWFVAYRGSRASGGDPNIVKASVCSCRWFPRKRG